MNYQLSAIEQTLWAKPNQHEIFNYFNPIWTKAIRRCITQNFNNWFTIPRRHNVIRTKKVARHELPGPHYDVYRESITEQTTAKCCQFVLYNKKVEGFCQNTGFV